MLYYKNNKKTPYFNKFRGEPAILSMIGLSPLTTIHPSILQHARVQSSKLFKLFNLIMVRSPSFGSYSYNFVQFIYASIIIIYACCKNKLVDPLCKRYNVTILFFIHVLLHMLLGKKFQELFQHF